MTVSGILQCYIVCSTMLYSGISWNQLLTANTDARKTKWRSTNCIPSSIMSTPFSCRQYLSSSEITDRRYLMNKSMIFIDLVRSFAGPWHLSAFQALSVQIDIDDPLEPMILVFSSVFSSEIVFMIDAIVAPSRVSENWDVSDSNEMENLLNEWGARRAGLFLKACLRLPPAIGILVCPQHFPCIFQWGSHFPILKVTDNGKRHLRSTFHSS